MKTATGNMPPVEMFSSMAMGRKIPSYKHSFIFVTPAFVNCSTKRGEYFFHQLIPRSHSSERLQSHSQYAYLCEGGDHGQAIRGDGNSCWVPVWEIQYLRAVCVCGKERRGEERRGEERRGEERRGEERRGEERRGEERRGEERRGEERRGEERRGGEGRGGEGRGGEGRGGEGRGGEGRGGEGRGGEGRGGEGRGGEILHIYYYAWLCPCVRAYVSKTEKEAACVRSEELGCSASVPVLYCSLL